MRILKTADLRGLVTAEEAFRTVEEAYRQYGRYRAVLSAPPSMLLRGPTDAGSHHRIKGASAPDQGAIGIRIASYGTRGPRDRMHYCYIADYESGAPLGLIDEEWLHCLRTATTALVAAKHLARPGARVIGLIGAGRIPREMFPALARIFLAEDIRVMAKPFENAQEFAARHAAPDVPVRAVATAEEAVRGADIVIRSQPPARRFWNRAGWRPAPSFARWVACMKWRAGF